MNRNDRKMRCFFFLFFWLFWFVCSFSLFTKTRRDEKECNTIVIYFCLPTLYYFNIIVLLFAMMYENQAKRRGGRRRRRAVRLSRFACIISSFFSVYFFLCCLLFYYPCAMTKSQFKKRRINKYRDRAKVNGEERSD